MATSRPLRKARQSLQETNTSTYVPYAGRERRASRVRNANLSTPVQKSQSSLFTLTHTSDTTEKAQAVAEKIRAIAASNIILWSVVPSYMIQFFFWIFGLAAVVAEVTPGINWILPGGETYMFSNVVIGFLGFITMLYAAFVYTRMRVNWYGGPRGLAFAFCLGLYFVFFLNLFPWIGLWMLIVIFSKRQEGAL